MNYFARYLLSASLILLLSACSGMPKLFWDVDEGKGDGPAYARGASTIGVGEKNRIPLEVPPELRAELELPDTDHEQQSENAALVPTQYRNAVAGKAVALNARLYQVESMRLFSAAVDAMTSLNLPVGSVDSPSGILTTDWIRKSSTTSAGMFDLGSLLGGGNDVKAYRYRFVVRVFKTDAEVQPQSRLEVRLISQVYMNRHWINKPIKSKPSRDLFAAVEKQLGLIQPLQPESIESKSE